jgi:hypothetical protein
VPAAAATSFSPCAASPASGHDEWSDLDRDIESLAASWSPQGGDLAVHGLLRALYGYASDTSGNLFMGADDISGFALERAQIEVEGTVEDYSFRMQYEAAGGVAALLDAYAAWQINEYVRFTMGNFRPPLLFESLLDDSHRLFILRTDAGELFYGRDMGARLEGRYDRFRWTVATQNGADSIGDDMAVSGRFGLDILGDGQKLARGAYDGTRQHQLSVNLAGLDDASAPSSGEIVAADAQWSYDRFAADAHVVNFGDDPGFFGPRSDSTAYQVTASFMIVPQKYELAVQYQETDNVDGDSAITVGVNRYVSGHDVKWLVNFASAESDDGSKEFDVFLIGLNIRV